MLFRSKTTAMHVAEVRGSLIQCATEHVIPLFEYTPAQIKSATSGFGRAGKSQVAATLRMLMKIDKHIRYDDEYDAIAVAVTHLSMHRAIQE